MVDLDFVFIFLMFGNLEDKRNVINAIRNMKLAKTTLLSKLSAVHNFCCTRTLCLSLTNAHTHTHTHTLTHSLTHTTEYRFTEQFHTCTYAHYCVIQRQRHTHEHICTIHFSRKHTPDKCTDNVRC